MADLIEPLREAATLLPGLVVGGLAAQLSAPVSCRWPARRDHLLDRLRAVRFAQPPGKARFILARLLLAGLLIGGTATAYAAQPGAANRPPGSSASRAGQNHQASLKPKTGANAVSASKAKAASGALPDWRVVTTTEDAANRLKGVYSAADQTVLNNQVAWGNWDNKPFAGMSLDQTRRAIIYNSKGKLNDIEHADQMDLMRAFWAGQRQAAIDSGYLNYVRFLDGEEAVGPDSFYVPGNIGWAGAGKDLGLGGAAGYVMAGNVDATGGFTLIKSPARGRPLFPFLADDAVASEKPASGTASSN